MVGDCCPVRWDGVREVDDGRPGSRNAFTSGSGGGFTLLGWEDALGMREFVYW